MIKTIEEVQESINLVYGNEIVKFKEIEKVCDTICRIITKSNCYNHLNLQGGKAFHTTFFQKGMYTDHDADIIVKHISFERGHIHTDLGDVGELVFYIKNPTVDEKDFEYELIKYKLFKR